MKITFSDLVEVLSQKFVVWKKTLNDEKKELTDDLEKIGLGEFKKIEELQKKILSLPEYCYENDNLDKTIENISQILLRMNVSDFKNTETIRDLTKILNIKFEIMRDFFAFVSVDSSYLTHCILHFGKILKIYLQHCTDYLDLLLGFESVFASISTLEFKDFKLGSPKFQNKNTDTLNIHFEEVIKSISIKNITRINQLGSREDPKINLITTNLITSTNFCSLQNLSANRDRSTLTKIACSLKNKREAQRSSSRGFKVTFLDISICFINFFLLEESELIPQIDQQLADYKEYVDFIMERLSSGINAEAMPIIRNLLFTIIEHHLILLNWKADYYYLNFKFDNCESILNEMQTLIDRLDKSTNGKIFGYSTFIEVLGRASGSTQVKKQLMKYFEKIPRQSEFKPSYSIQKQPEPVVPKDSTPKVILKNPDLKPVQTSTQENPEKSKKRKKKKKPKRKKQIKQNNFPLLQKSSSDHYQNNQCIIIQQDDQHRYSGYKTYYVFRDNSFLNQNESKNLQLSRYRRPILYWKPKNQPLPIQTNFKPITSNYDQKILSLGLRPRGWFLFGDFNWQVNSNIKKYFSLQTIPISIRVLIFKLNKFCEENGIEQPSLRGGFVRRFILGVFHHETPMPTNCYFLSISKPQNPAIQLLLTQKILALNAQFCPKTVLYSIIQYKNDQKITIDIQIQDPELECRADYDINSLKFFVFLNKVFDISHIQVTYHTDFFKDQSAIHKRFQSRELPIHKNQNIFFGREDHQVRLLYLASFSILEGWVFPSKTKILLRDLGGKLRVKNDLSYNFQQYRIFSAITFGLSNFLLKGYRFQYQLLDLFCELNWLSQLFCNSNERDEYKISNSIKKLLEDFPRMNIQIIYELYQGGCEVIQSSLSQHIIKICILNSNFIVKNIFNFFNIFKICSQFNICMLQQDLLKGLLEPSAPLSNHEFKFYWNEIACRLSYIFKKLDPIKSFKFIHKSGALAKLFYGAAHFCDIDKLNYLQYLSNESSNRIFLSYVKQPNSIAVIFLIGELLWSCRCDDNLHIVLSGNNVNLVKRYLSRAYESRYQFIIEQLYAHQIIDLINFTYEVIHKNNIFYDDYKICLPMGSNLFQNRSQIIPSPSYSVSPLIQT